mmetsp:Transcript_24695/g.65851  ORF Transcript_24695/g.65851 Transcript_24695/m.65851 type:complete len:125 (-) Transcript_24695:153-527(-)
MAESFRAYAGSRYPHYGLLYMGFGGSGILIHRPHVPQLIHFVLGHIFASLVLVAIFKYGNYYRTANFAVNSTLLVHRGVTSSILISGGEWGACGAPSRQLLGEYSPCPDRSWGTAGCCAPMVFF